MKNYFTYIVCLFLVGSFITCNQENVSEESQVVDNQRESQQNTITHQPQSAPKTLTDDVDKADEKVDVIEQIRANYAATIQKLDNGELQKITKEFECDNDPVTGALSRYMNGNEVVFLEYSIGGEHGWRSQKIYFKDGEPYFVFAEDGTWYFGGPEGTDNTGENTVDDITETRYYLENGKVIRKLSKKYLIESWKAKPDVSKIPNQTVTDGVGEAYPDAGEIPNWLKGKAGC